MKDKNTRRPNQQRKASEVLLEYLAAINPDALQSEDYSRWLDLAIGLWNIGLLGEESHGWELQGLCEQLNSSNREPRKREKSQGRRSPAFTYLDLAGWLELRRSRFGSDRRQIIECRMVPRNGHESLQLLSIDLDREEKDSMARSKGALVRYGGSRKSGQRLSYRKAVVGRINANQENHRNESQTP